LKPDESIMVTPSRSQGNGYMHRVGRWFRESF